MVNLREIPKDLYQMMKLKLAARKAEKQTPLEPHWAYCYAMLREVLGSFSLAIQQLDSDLRDAVCIYYLVLQTLDDIEADTSNATELKVAMLMDFHRHIYDHDWRILCGRKKYKVRMDEFHHVSTAFLELGSGYQEAIEDITMRKGAGMAKFMRNEVEIIDVYDEYCHYYGGLVGLGLSKLFHASGREDLASDAISISMGSFLKETNVISYYFEGINEKPKPCMFWPRQIWSKYVYKLEDSEYEGITRYMSDRLNYMITNALIHVEDCLKYMSDLRDPAIFRFCAIPQMLAIAMLCLCYNNTQVFRGGLTLRSDFADEIIDRTKTMSDVYGTFYDCCRVLKSEIDDKDPISIITKDILKSILKICRDSGTLKQRKSYIIEIKPQYTAIKIAVIFIILAIIELVYLYRVSRNIIRVLRSFCLN